MIQLLFCEALNSYKTIYSGFSGIPKIGRKSLKVLVGGPRLELGTSCL